MSAQVVLILCRDAYGHQLMKREARLRSEGFSLHLPGQLR